MKGIHKTVSWFESRRMETIFVIKSYSVSDKKALKANCELDPGSNPVHLVLSFTPEFVL